ncbi:hypothetical protein [uncultured Tenacibaculum sp.]|uniref:hypothetical protein n=1 Tax=uncultured Tenacibaculum sp. TaxID=174713 RepID=UPI002606F011|nr:hypothetical protein [uncultured Tenacibaculum sp.]
MLKENKNYLKGVCILFALLSTIMSCKNEDWRNIKIISPDKIDTISVITIKTKRYIFNGGSNKIPKNYALVDISDVSELGDEIGVCWNKDSYKWKLISFYSKFEHNNLDEKKYFIESKPLTDKNGIPNHEEYFEENCVVVYPKGDLIRPKENASLIYE